MSSKYEGTVSINTDCTSDENEKVRRPLLNGSGSPNQNGSVSPQSVTIEEEVKFIDRGSTIKDKYNVIYMVFLLFGIATLLPWNVFITAEDVSPTITILEHLIKTFLFNFVLCVYIYSSTSLNTNSIQTQVEMLHIEPILLSLLVHLVSLLMSS